ncbi:MAG: polysaccharide biosynthesis C-terminal domain-containing protein, partial [Vicinamibacterales bacterium]
AVVCALALVLNVSANLWLIPAMGIDGAAWATVATEVVVTIGCAWGLRGRFLSLPPAAEPASVALG